MRTQDGVAPVACNRGRAATRGSVIRTRADLMRSGWPRLLATGVAQRHEVEACVEGGPLAEVRPRSEADLWRLRRPGCKQPGLPDTSPEVKTGKTHWIIPI